LDNPLWGILSARRISDIERAEALIKYHSAEFIVADKEGIQLGRLRRNNLYAVLRGLLMNGHSFDDGPNDAATLTQKHVNNLRSLCLREQISGVAAARLNQGQDWDFFWSPKWPNCMAVLRFCQYPGRRTCFTLTICK